MLKITVIALGSMNEKYFAEAAAEYKKRLSPSILTAEVELKPCPVPKAPTDGDIARALASEAKAIKAAIPRASYTIALCVEGREMTSGELASTLEEIPLSGKSSVCFIIGSSYGLADEIKNMCDMRLSLSRLTLAHCLARVVLYEALYRAFGIIKGTKYDK